MAFLTAMPRPAASEVAETSRAAAPCSCSRNSRLPMPPSVSARDNLSIQPMDSAPGSSAPDGRAVFLNWRANFCIRSI